MATLRIEHSISDFTTWKTAFDHFSALRNKAGVRSHRIFSPVDDAAYIMLDLDFDEAIQAETFLTILRSDV